MAKIKEREAEAADKEVEKARAAGDVEKRRMAERRAYKAREAAQEKRAEGKEAAREVAKAISTGIRSGSVGTRKVDADIVRMKVEQKYEKKKQAPPWIDSVVGKVARYAYKTLGKDDPFCVHVGRLVQAKAYIGPISGKDLVTNLRDLAARANGWANKLEGYGSMYTDGGRPTKVVVKAIGRSAPKALLAKNP